MPPYCSWSLAALPRIHLLTCFSKFAQAAQGFICQHELCYRLGGRQLAVLHPRTLTIYSLNSLASSQGIAGLQLNKVSEQSLERSAANMICASFGGSTGTSLKKQKFNHARERPSAKAHLHG